MEEWTRQRIAEARCKWPHEIDELDADEWNRLLAYEYVKAKEVELS